MNEMINKIGERLIIKARCVNEFLLRWEGNEISGNPRNNPDYSEFRGMLQMVKAMEIDFEVIFNDKASQMVAIDINGKRFEI